MLFEISVAERTTFHIRMSDKDPRNWRSVDEITNWPSSLPNINRVAELLDNNPNPLGAVSVRERTPSMYIFFTLVAESYVQAT